MNNTREFAEIDAAARELHIPRWNITNNGTRIAPEPGFGHRVAKADP